MRRLFHVKFSAGIANAHLISDRICQCLLGPPGILPHYDEGDNTSKDDLGYSVSIWFQLQERDCKAKADRSCPERLLLRLLQAARELSTPSSLETHANPSRYPRDLAPLS